MQSRMKARGLYKNRELCSTPIRSFLSLTCCVLLAFWSLFCIDSGSGHALYRYSYLPTSIPHPSPTTTSSSSAVSIQTQIRSSRKRVHICDCLRRQRKIGERYQSCLGSAHFGRCVAIGEQKETTITSFFEIALSTVQMDR